MMTQRLDPELGYDPNDIDDLVYALSTLPKQEKIKIINRLLHFKQLFLTNPCK